VIRRLWQGDLVTHHGRFFTVDRARIYTLPDEPPPIAVAAAGPQAAELAGREGDALVSTSPDEQVVSAFEQAGGGDKPRYGQLTVCYAPSEREAVETAHTIWPNAAVEGQLTQELPLPAHYQQAAEMVTPQDVAESIVCGPDPERYRKEIERYEEAGFDHVYLHQVGPDQESFFRFARNELTLAPR